VGRIGRGIVAGLLAACVAGAAGAQFRDPADPGADPPARPAPRFEPPDGPRRLPEPVDPKLRFTIRERDLFGSWAVAEYGKGKCPPGLAKRDGGGCLPRGHARKRYTLGQPLPAGVVPAPVPLDLTRRIGMPPLGYRYGMIDGDLVKLAVGSGVAVDAVDGFIPK
jgi:hypothetical protein